MGSTLNAVAVVCTTWSSPLGVSASALIYSTAVRGRKRASIRWRTRAALSIDFSIQTETDAGLGNEVQAIDRWFLSVSLAEVLCLGHLPVPPSVMPVVPS